MWLFLISDSLTFSVLLICYAYVRLASPNWPRPYEIWPDIFKSSIMTVFLLSSSLTMVMAVSAAHKGKRGRAVTYLLGTMLGGSLFIWLHMTEWLELIVDKHVTPWSNPWGAPLFGGAFFGLTGMHMLHVTVGVLYLGIIAIGFGRGKFSPEDVEVSGLYWHFVDLVWMFIFPLIYLLSVNLKG
jgi:cytochrome c oxidase subunit 3